MKIRKAYINMIILGLVLMLGACGLSCERAFKQYFESVEKSKLSHVTSEMRDLKDALDDYILTKGKPDSDLGYGPTLTILNVKHSNACIHWGKYRIYAMLSNNFGGWWIQVDSDKYGDNVIRWQADGSKTCKSSGDFAFLCNQLKADGLAN